MEKIPYTRTDAYENPTVKITLRIKSKSFNYEFKSNTSMDS